MTTTTGLPPELEAYLAAVRATLADLAPEERDDLLGELQAALVEAAGEGEGPIAARLGPPEEFAAELRASAGLDPAPPPGPVQDGRRDWRADLRRVAEPLRRVGRELAPIWWVGRAYVLVAGLAVAGTFEWSFRQPALPRISNTATTIIVLALAAVGLRRPRPARASGRPGRARGVGGVRRADPAARDPRARAHRRREARTSCRRPSSRCRPRRPRACRSSAAR